MTVLRASRGSTRAAIAELARVAQLHRHPLGALRAARQGGLAAAVALAALRDPGAVALIRGDDVWTAGRLEAAVRGRAAEFAPRPAAGPVAVAVAEDGGIRGIIDLAAATRAGRDAVPIGPRLADDDVARLTAHIGTGTSRRGRLLVPSTGTGGRAHGVPRGPLGPRALLQLADVERRLGLPTGRPLLVLAPLDHGHGLSAVAAGLVRGLPVVLASRLPVEEQAALVARHRPGAVTGVPAQLARLDGTGVDWSRVGVVVSGSSPLPPGLRRRIASAGPRVVDAFGTTETGTLAVDGAPVAGVRVRLARDGRLVVRSPLGGRGESVLPDAARIEGGRLTGVHRVDGLVDSGGETADPARLRSALEALPGVRAARVEVETDELLGAVLIADVTIEPDGPGDPGALRDALRGRVAAAELPRRIVISRPAAPRTTRG